MAYYDEQVTAEARIGQAVYRGALSDRGGFDDVLDEGDSLWDEIFFEMGAAAGHRCGRAGEAMTDLTGPPIGQLRRVEYLTCKETPLWEPTWTAPKGQQFLVLVLGLAPKGESASAEWIRARLEEALSILSRTGTAP